MLTDLINMVEILQRKLNQHECVINVLSKSEDIPEKERVVLDAVDEDLLNSGRLIDSIKRHCCDKQKELINTEP